MYDRRMPIVGLERAADLFEKIWPDQIGKGVSEKARLAGEELLRIETRQESHLEKANAVRRFCEGVIEQESSDKQKSYGQKRRRFYG